MTIALRIELKEKWGNFDEPRVDVVATSVVPRRPGERVVATLSPERPIAEVCITKDEDLKFVVHGHTANCLNAGKCPP